MKHIYRHLRAIVACGLLVLSSSTFAKSASTREMLCCILSRLQRISTAINNINILIENEGCTATFITFLPYVIGTSGVYVMPEDMTYEPAAGGTSAITIAANHVTLDLCSNTLLQANGPLALNTQGISVVPGAHDIEIRNGTIADFSESGITVGTLGGAATSDVYIHDITVERNGVTIVDGVVTPLSTTPNDNAGVRIINTTDVYIYNVQANGNGSLDRSAAGIGILNSRRIKIENVIANNNRSDWINPLESVAAGIGIRTFAFPGLPASGEIDIINATTDSNQGVQASAGIVTLLSENISIRDSSAKGSFILPPATAPIGARANGYAFILSSKILLANSFVGEISNAHVAGVGELVSGAAGVVVTGCNAVTIDPVIVSEVTSAGDYAAGFLVIPAVIPGVAVFNTENVTVRGCQALLISNVNPNAGGEVDLGLFGQAVGFGTARSDTISVTTSRVDGAIFQECIAEDITAGAVGIPGGRAVGFLMQQTFQALVERCVACRTTNNATLLANLSGVGIQVASQDGVFTGNLTKVMVKDNIVYENALAGIENQSLDDTTGTTPTDNAISGNYAYHNGTPGGIGNYADSSTGAPDAGLAAGIVVWPMHSGPAPLVCIDQKLVNSDIQQATGVSGSDDSVCTILAEILAALSA